MTTLRTCADSAEVVLGGLGIRPVVLPHAGDTVYGHKHRFDHVMFCMSGSIHVHATCDAGCNKEYTMEPGSFVLIPATWRHAITALTDGVKFVCVFSQCDANGTRDAAFMADIDEGV